MTEDRVLQVASLDVSTVRDLPPIAILSRQLAGNLF